MFLGDFQQVSLTVVKKQRKLSSLGLIPTNDGIDGTPFNIYKKKTSCFIVIQEVVLINYNLTELSINKAICKYIFITEDR